MNPGQQNMRRNAAQEFMNSLDQLGSTLNPSEQEIAPVDQTSDRQDNDPQADTNATDIDAEVLALEEAAADIERYIQAQQSQL